MTITKVEKCIECGHDYYNNFLKPDKYNGLCKDCCHKHAVNEKVTDWFEVEA